MFSVIFEVKFKAIHYGKEFWLTRCLGFVIANMGGDIIDWFTVLQNYIIGAFKPACNISIAFTDGKNRKQVIDVHVVDSVDKTVFGDCVLCVSSDE